MKRIIITVCLAGILTGLFSADIRAEEIVNLATLVWRPYIGPDLPAGGPVTEIAVRAFEYAGYTTTVAYLPWIEAITRTASNEFDAIYPAYYSDDRADIFHISDPLLASPVILCARTGTTIQSFAMLQQLKPYRIGIVEGYANAIKFDQANYLNKFTGQSDYSNMTDLANGYLDMVCIDKMVCVDMIESNPETLGSLDDYIFITPKLGVRDMYLMLPKTDGQAEQRVTKVNAALATMRKNGHIEEILTHHGYK